MLTAVRRISGATVWSRFINFRLYSINFEGNYSTTESNKILEVVNSNSSENLSRFNISKARISKIDRWKLKHGPFSSVGQILEVDGFGTKVLEKFCESIVHDNPETPSASSSTTKTSKSNQQLTIPKLLEKRRSTTKSCVSIQVGINNISWCRLSITDENTIHITNWTMYEIIDKKMHLSELIRVVLYVNSRLPEGDCYILENPKVQQGGAPNSVLQVNINLQNSQLIAMTSAVLANRNAIDSSPESDSDDNKDKEDSMNVFYLRQYLSSRLFGTFIGNERVSNQAIVENLIESNCDSSVIVPDSIKEDYRSSSNVEKELLGQSFLLGLTFIRLCVLKCPKSFSLISNLR